MKEVLVIPSPYKEMMQEISKIGYYWAELPLVEHPILTQFNRKLVISGFNSPDLENEQDKRLYITIKQIFTDKNTGKVFLVKNAPMWIIYADSWSYVRNINDASKYVEVDKQTFDDEGNLVKTEKVRLQANTIDYLKYQVINKKAHLIDLFSTYLNDFAVAFKDELDKL